MNTLPPPPLPTQYTPAPAPSLALFGVEPLRAAMEYASMRLMATDALPRGDGHAVVVFPGLAGDVRSTRPLLDLCTRLGYEAYDWGLGANRGPRGDVDTWLSELADHVDALTADHRSRISLIGWSLGGIYAREVAKKIPKRVRCVITLGTPFAGTPEQTNVAWFYRLLNGQKLSADEELLTRLRTAPAAPTLSIYSRTDGVVAWQACMNHDCPHVEHVEVAGSHCGLGWNPAALEVIARTLARRAAHTPRIAADGLPSSQFQRPLPATL
jgi:pimeloyl-ACP methyl ester carboxylesterase